MIGQKERACPCANTDKPKENTDGFLPSEYTIDCDCLQYAGVLYYAGASFRHPRCCGCLIRSWGN